MQNYGERLKTARKANGYTQTELAELLGISQKSYQRMETGVHDLKMTTIFKICKTLKISADWFLGLSAENKTNLFIFTRFYTDVIDIICDYGDDELIDDEVVTKLTNRIDRLKVEYAKIAETEV